MKIFGILIILLAFTLYVWTILKIDKKDPNRLLWYVILFFFPILGPLVFLIFFFKEKQRLK